MLKTILFILVFCKMGVAQLPHQFQDPVEQTRFFLNLLYRYPRLNSLNSTFNRSITGYFRAIPRIDQELQIPAETWEIKPQHLYGFQFLAADSSYDLKGLQEIQSELSRRAIKFFEEGKVEDFKTAVETFGNQNALSLLPFMFDRQGHKRFDDLSTEEDQDAFLSSLENISGEELKHNYKSLLEQAQKLAQSQHQKDQIQSVINNFAIRFVEPRLVLRTNDGTPIKPQKMSLEEVPPMIATIRAAVGLDCSLKSVGYHALLPGAKTYWVRLGHKITDQIVGYVFVMPVIYKGKSIPFVITINGPGLRATHVKPLLDGMSALWKSDQLALPFDEDLDGGAMNDGAIIDTIKAESLTKNQRASAATDLWVQLDSYLDENPSTMSFENYYVIPSTKEIPVQIRTASHLPQILELGLSTNNHPIDFMSLSILGRARLAARLGRTMKVQNKTLQIALSILNIDHAQFETAKNLEYLRRNTELTLEQWNEAFSILQIEPIDLKFINTRVLTRRMSELLETQPQLVNDPRWQDLFKYISVELDQRVKRQSQTGKGQSLKKLKQLFNQALVDPEVWAQWNHFSPGGPERIKILNTYVEGTGITPIQQRILLSVLRDQKSEEVKTALSIIKNKTSIGKGFYRELLNVAWATDADTRKALIESLPPIIVSDSEYRIIQKDWSQLITLKQSAEERQQLIGVLKNQDLWRISNLKMIRQTTSHHITRLGQAAYEFVCSRLLKK